MRRNVVGAAASRRVLIPLVLICLCSAIMAPRLLSPQFGLLDDGTTLTIAERYAGDPLALLDLEAARGRFRPVYWLFYIAQYPLWSKAPLGYFAVQWLAFTLTTLVVYRTIREVTGDPVPGAASGVAFLAAAPIWENYYTLSKPEPPLVLFLATATLFLFRSLEPKSARTARRNAYLGVSAVLTGLAYFTKETAVVMLPVSVILVSLAWSNHAARRTLMLYCVANVCWFSGYVVLRLLAQTQAIADGNDSLHYSLNGPRLYASAVDSLAWVIRDFAFALPLIICAACLGWRQSRFAGARLAVVYGVVFGVLWLAIMLPWHSSLEYYLLPLSLGVALGVGGSVHIIRSQLHHGSVAVGVAVSAALLLFAVPLANGYTTGRVQLTVDRTNAEFAGALARLAPPATLVAVGLPNDSEYIFELGLQLRELYGRPDIRVTGDDTTQAPLRPGDLVAIQDLQNQHVTMPRMVAGNQELERRYAARLSTLWSLQPEFQVTYVNTQETICRAVRWLGLAAGRLCENPILVFERRPFTYGWRLYRLAG